MKRIGWILLLVLCLSSPTTSFGKVVSSPNFYSDVVSVIYKDGTLNVQGLTGIGTITIYSIIGNKVVEFRQVPLENFSRSIALEGKTMFILRIETPNEVKTYKLVTR